MNASINSSTDSHDDSKGFDSLIHPEKRCVRHDVRNRLSGTGGKFGRPICRPAHTEDISAPASSGELCAPTVEGFKPPGQ